MAFASDTGLRSGLLGASEAAGASKRLSNLVRGRHLAAQFLRELQPAPAPVPPKSPSPTSVPVAKASPQRENTAVADSFEERSSVASLSSARSELFVDPGLIFPVIPAGSGARISRNDASSATYLGAQGTMEPTTAADQASLEMIVRPAGDQLIRRREEKERQVYTINKKFEEEMRVHLSLAFRAWKRCIVEEFSVAEHSSVVNVKTTTAARSSLAFGGVTESREQSRPSHTSGRRGSTPSSQGSLNPLLGVLLDLRSDMAQRLHLKLWRQLVETAHRAGSQVSRTGTSQVRASLRVELVKAGKASAVTWRMAVLAWHQEIAARRGTFARVAEQIHVRRRLRLEGGVWWASLKREVSLLSLAVKSWMSVVKEGAVVDAAEMSNLERMYRSHACTLASFVAEWLTVGGSNFIAHAVLASWNRAVVGDYGPNADEVQQMQQELLRLQQYLVKHFMWWVQRQERIEISWAFRAWCAAIPHLQESVGRQESPARQRGTRGVAAQIAAQAMELNMHNCLNGWKQRMLRDGDRGFKQIFMMTWLLVAITERRSHISGRLSQARELTSERRFKDMSIALLRLLLSSWQYEARAARIGFVVQNAARQQVHRSSAESDMTFIFVCWHALVVQLFSARALRFEMRSWLRALYIAWCQYASRRQAVAATVCWRPIHAWRRNFDAGLLPSTWYWWLRATSLNQTGPMRAIWRLLRWHRHHDTPLYENPSTIARTAARDLGKVQRVLAAEFALMRRWLRLWQVTASVHRTRQMRLNMHKRHVERIYDRNLLNAAMFLWLDTVATSSQSREYLSMQGTCESLERRHMLRAEQLWVHHFERVAKMLQALCLFTWYRFARSRWAERTMQKAQDLRSWSHLTMSTKQVQYVNKEILASVFRSWCQDALRTRVHSSRDLQEAAEHRAALSRALSKALLVQQIGVQNSLRGAWCLRAWRQQLIERHISEARRVILKRRQIILSEVVEGCVETADFVRLQSCWDSWGQAVRLAMSERSNLNLQSMLQRMPRKQRLIGAEWLGRISDHEQLLQHCGQVFLAWALASVAIQTQDLGAMMRSVRASSARASKMEEDTARVCDKYRLLGENYDQLSDRYSQLRENLSTALGRAQDQVLASVVLHAWARESSRNTSIRLMMRLRRGALWAVSRLGTESTMQVARDAFHSWATAVVSGSEERAKDLSCHLQEQSTRVLVTSAREREHRYRAALALAEALGKAHTSALLSAMVGLWQRSVRDSRTVVLQSWIADLEAQLASQTRALQIQEALYRGSPAQAGAGSASVPAALNLQQMLADVRREADIEKSRYEAQSDRIRELEQQVTDVQGDEDHRIVEELQERLSSASSLAAVLHSQRKSLEQQVASARSVAQEQATDSLVPGYSESEALVRRQQGDTPLAVEQAVSARTQRIQNLELQLSDACAQEAMLRGQVADLKQQLESAQVLAQASSESQGQALHSRIQRLELEQQLAEARDRQAQHQQRHEQLSQRASNLEEQVSNVSSVRIPLVQPSHPFSSPGRSARSVTVSGSVTARSPGRSARPQSTARTDQEEQQLQDLFAELEELRCVIQARDERHADEILARDERHADELVQCKSNFLALSDSLLDLVVRGSAGAELLHVMFQSWAMAARISTLTSAREQLTEALRAHVLEKMRFWEVLGGWSAQVAVANDAGHISRVFTAWRILSKSLCQLRNIVGRHASRHQDTHMLQYLGGWRLVVIQEVELREEHGRTKVVHGLRQRDHRRHLDIFSGGLQQMVLLGWAGAHMRCRGRRRSMVGATHLTRSANRTQMRASFLVWQRVRAQSRTVEQCNARFAAQVSEHAAHVAAQEVAQGHHRSASRRIAVRMHLERSRRFAAFCIAAWAQATNCKRGRQRSALQAQLLFSSWTRDNSALLLKSILCVWIDVMIVVQTAALRLGIKQTASALEFNVDSEAQLRHQSKAVPSLAPPATSDERVLALAAVMQWKGLTRHKRRIEDFVALAWRTATTSDDLSIVHRAWAKWRSSASNSSRHKTTLEAHSSIRATRSRCAAATLWALEVVAERESVLACSVTRARAWRAWIEFLRGSDSSPRSAPRAIADARLEEHCHVTVGITLALWSQEQHRMLARMTFALWFWSAGCLTLRDHVERLRQDITEVHIDAEHARLVADQSAQRMLRSWSSNSAALMLSMCFMAWHRLQSASRSGKTSKPTGTEDQNGIRQCTSTGVSSVVKRFLQSSDRGLLQICLLRWHEAGHRARQVRSMSYYATLFTRSSGTTTLATSSLSSSFLQWRLCSVSTLRQRQKDDLAMMVELLQQSTTTCKELRSCLLAQRHDAAYAAFFALRSVFYAWCGCVRPGIGAGRA